MGAETVKATGIRSPGGVGPAPATARSIAGAGVVVVLASRTTPPTAVRTQAASEGDRGRVGGRYTCRGRPQAGSPGTTSQTNAGSACRANASIGARRRAAGTETGQVSKASAASSATTATSGSSAAGTTTCHRPACTYCDFAWRAPRGRPARSGRICTQICST